MMTNATTDNWFGGFMNRAWSLAGIVALSLSLIGIQPALARTGPHVVKVVAKDFSYSMPDRIPAGPTLFHFINDGHQIHHMTIIKFKKGKTLKDLTSLPPGPFPSWAVFMGGPNAPAPNGGQSRDIVNVAPGHYASICLVPGPDGKPHMMDGMVKAFTVTRSARKGMTPKADMTLSLVDYTFKFSKMPTAGHHVIHVVNHGTQPHESVFFLLKPGKTGEDVFKWVGSGMKGTPPGMPLGGTGPMNPGHSNTLLMNFKPGNYAIICFMPDAKNGKPHAAHGMIYNFKVN